MKEKNEDTRCKVRYQREPVQGENWIDLGGMGVSRKRSIRPYLTVTTYADRTCSLACVSKSLLYAIKTTGIPISASAM